MADVPDDIARGLLREMLRIRLFEEEASARSDDGEIPGFLHLCRGHEGVHAGMGAAMEPDDWLAVGGARLHGQYLAKGLPMERVMAELYGKEGGSNHGKGGSMHVSDTDRHLYGHAATIGSGQNPAAGLALAQQQRDTGNVVVCTIGDGGTSRGSFHTALVFAAYWDLPVVYIIENNQWAISTPRAALAPDHLADYGKPHQLPTAVIDGTDATEVYETVSEAIERARNGDGPTVIEAEVQRLVGHFEADKQTYREDEEFDEAAHDPLEKLRERLEADGIVDETEYDRMSERVQRRVDEAVEFARESDFPAPEATYDHVYRLPLYGQEEDEEGEP